MSTSDRELLELAAKSSHQEIHWTPDGKCYRIENGLRFSWNPLTDDGDALRLAVKLKLEILFFDGFAEIAVEHNNDGHLQVTEQYADDMNAATRRAIVRAAAEIGRSME